MMKKILATIICLIAFASTAHATTYYVSTTGSDSNSGTSLTSAWGSLQHAADKMVGGDVTLVANGVYSTTTISTSTNAFYSSLINLNNANTSYVTFKAMNKWGAILSGNNFNFGYGININTTNAAYYRFEGFQFTQFYWDGAELNPSRPNTANHFDFVNNIFWNIGRVCNTSAYGEVGSFISPVSDVLFDGNIFHDIGRLQSGEQGCNGANYFNDHELYIDGVQRMVVRNNLFYNEPSGWQIQIYGSIPGATSTDLFIYNNTFYGGNSNVLGQIILDSQGCISCSIFNNIFYQPKTAGIRMQNDGAATYLNNTIANNMVYGGVLQSFANSYLTAYPNGYNPNIATSSNWENTDPKVVAAPNLDFRLTSASPAIDAGLSTTTFTNDMNYVYRPQGAGIDLGAYEYAQTEMTSTGNVSLSGNVSIQ